MDVLALATRIPTMVFGAKSDDDFSDRLNYRYTVALLILFSIVLTTRQFGSEVIKCWVPAHFTSNYEQYVTQVCWISNTYYFNATENIPKSPGERAKAEIKYYQWVSFVLLFQAFMFYAPRVFWRTASLKCGLNICDLVEAAHSYKSVEKYDNREKLMGYLVKNIDQYVDDNRRFEDNRHANPFFRCLMTSFPCCGRFMGNYIVILYFVVKFVYIFNTVAQTAIIGILLGKNFWQFGIDFFINLVSYGEGWQVNNSKYFPKVTLCDFMIREVGNPNKSHKYTVQCVLPINLFNQQIFTAIWIWYFVVLVWNLLEAIKWISRCIPYKANKWITQRISLINSQLGEDSKRLRHFLGIYLEPDGIFMIRMISNNTSDYVATDLIHHLWCQHAEKYDSTFPDEPHNVKDVKCLFEHNKGGHKDDDNGRHGCCHCRCICSVCHRAVTAGGEPSDPQEKKPLYQGHLPRSGDPNAFKTVTIYSNVGGAGSTLAQPRLMGPSRLNEAADVRSTNVRKRSDNGHSGGGGGDDEAGQAFIDLNDLRR